MKRPVFRLPDEFGNKIPVYFLEQLYAMKKHSGFEGEADYVFYAGEDGIYFTPELEGNRREKKSLYEALNEMFPEMCRNTIEHLQK